MKEDCIMNLICPRCGNNKKFYKEISIAAKLKVNNKGQDLKTIYDINKSDVDNYCENIFCDICGAEAIDKSTGKSVTS
jgi:hypothetical protein